MANLAALRASIIDKSRMGTWLIVSLVLCVVVFFLAKQQLGVTIYKLSLITLGGYIGYWIDRGLFYYARPDAVLDNAVENWADMARWEALTAAASWAMLRRAIIVSACILTAGLGA